MAIRYFDFIAHNAGRYPDKLALVDLHSTLCLTYRQLDQRVSRLAECLKTQYGVRKSDRVALLASNSNEYLETLFACSRLGALVIPLNWRLTTSELYGIIQDGAPVILLCDAQCRVQAEALARLSVNISSMELGSVDYNDIVTNGDPVGESAVLMHDDVQIIMYTSGTTGSPKGALLTYGMAFWNAVNLGIPGSVTPATKNLSVMPMFHTAGLNVYALPTLHAGGTVLIMRSFDAGAVLKAIDNPDFGVTHFFGVPSAWQIMSQHALFPSTDFTRIVLAGVGGAPVPVPLLETWQQRGVYLQNGFGMTETSPSVTTLAPEDAIRKVGSIGKPVLHTEIRIVLEDGTEAGTDEAGELWVKGPNVTPGYWRREDLTGISFVDGWLRSGDIVRRDADGFLFILDRRKDMYISGGENVYPAEVESTLLGLEAIASVAVIGVTDARWGETGVAVIVVRPGMALTTADVLSHCNAHLARFKHPREIVFVEELPLTASGKVHKPTLRERFQARGP